MGGSIPKNKTQTIKITKDCMGEKIDVAFPKKFCLTVLLRISEGVNGHLGSSRWCSLRGPTQGIWQSLEARTTKETDLLWRERQSLQEGS